MTHTMKRWTSLILSFVAILFSAHLAFAATGTVTVDTITVNGLVVTITGTVSDIATIYYSTDSKFLTSDPVVVTPDSKGNYSATIDFRQIASLSGTYYVRATADDGKTYTPLQTFVISATTNTTKNTVTIGNISVNGLVVTITGTVSDIATIYYSTDSKFLTSDPVVVTPDSKGNYSATIDFRGIASPSGTYYVRATADDGKTYTPLQTFVIADTNGSNGTGSNGTGSNGTGAGTGTGTGTGTNGTGTGTGTGNGTGTGTDTGTTTGTVTATARVVQQDTFADIYLKLTGTYGSNAVLIKYGASGEKTLTKSATAMFNGTEYYGGLTKLLPNTTYYYEPYSTIDQSSLAPLAYFQTHPNVENSKLVPNVVTALTIKNIKQNEVTVTGKVALVTNEIEFLIDKTGNGVFDANTTPEIQNDKTFSFTITGLKAGSVYHLVPVKPGNIKVRLWNVVPFATLPVSITAYVSDLKPTTATISAQISAGADNATVYYGKDTKSLTNIVNLRTVTSEAGLYSAPIVNLTPDTGYFYQVKSGDGKIVYTNPATFVTPPNPAGAVTVPTINGTGTGSGASGSASTTPTFAGLVTCGLDGPLSNGNNGVQSCSFEEFMKLINRLISFLIYIVAPIIMTFVMLWGGVLILTGAGNAESIGKGKGMIVKAIMGLVLAMSGWLIIQFTLTHLGYREFDPVTNVSGFPRFY